MAKRGRPAGSKNKPKSTTSAPPAPGSKPGHNALSDEEQKALHEKHVGEYEKALKGKKEADAEFKNVCKRIKAEGGKVSSVKLSIELKTPEGEARLRSDLEEMTRIARWNGVGVQLDLLNVAEPSSVDRARDEARRDANSGQPCKTDYAPGTAEYDSYMEEWHKATAERNAAISKAVNGDAGDAAAKSFEDAVDDVESDDDGRPPEIPAELRREPEPAEA